MPMALSAEQNAPLGRAVIGGLFCATIATLFFVPVDVLNSSMRAGRRRTRRASDQRNVASMKASDNPEDRPICIAFASEASFRYRGSARARSCGRWIFFPTAQRLKAPAELTKEGAMPSVALVAPSAGPGLQDVVLPSNVHYSTTPAPLSRAGLCPRLEIRHRREGEGGRRARDRRAPIRPAVAAGEGRADARRSSARSRKAHFQMVVGATRLDSRLATERTRRAATIQPRRRRRRPHVQMSRG